MRLYVRASLSASVADKVKMVDPEAACSETVVRVLPSEATLVNTGAAAARKRARETKVKKLSYSKMALVRV